MTAAAVVLVSGPARTQEVDRHAAPTAQAAHDQAQPPEPAAAPVRLNEQRIAGLVLGGAGVLGVGIGAIFGVHAKNKLDESNEDGRCQGNLCNHVGIKARNDAWAAGTMSTVLFLAGGAALAGGVALFLTAPSPERASVEVAVGPQGISVRGGF